MGAILKRCGVTAVLLLTALPAATHHSRSMFDRERSITIQGVVAQYEWANPHVYLHVEMQSDSGEPVVWALELGSTTEMRRRGWSGDLLMPGDRVSVQGNPARETGRNLALVTLVQRAGVTLLDRANSGEGFGRSEESAFKADSLSGIWVVPWDQPYFGRFSNPSSLRLTERGNESVENYDDSTMNPQIRCMARSTPWFMVFPSVQKIEVGDGSVSIRSEYGPIERTVHMDETSRASATASYHGHSTGRWEGEVLVVETTHFSDHRSGNARGVPSGPQKHLVERFELSPDRESLFYRFRLEDPEYLLEPVTGVVQSAFRPDLEFEPVACDLENARRFVGG